MPEKPDPMRGFDASRNVSGVATAQNVLLMLDLLSIQVKEQPRVLSLAAGQAKSELHFAEQLHAAHLTLVDKSRSPLDDNPTISVVEADVAEFVKSYQGKAFDAVTIFGAELLPVLAHKNIAMDFFTQLRQIVTTDALVIVEPVLNALREMLSDEDLQKCGYISLAPLSSSFYLRAI